MGKYDIEAQKGPGNGDSRSHAPKVTVDKYKNEMSKMTAAVSVPVELQ